MVSEQFSEIVKEIQENDKEFKMTPRELLDAFGCEKRTSGNLVRIEKYLEDNKLETNPEYTNGWIDCEIILKHKKKAKSKNRNNPVHRLKILPAANCLPVSISRDAKLSEAITLMMMHNYSQLPVMSGIRKVEGVITWESIGYALTNGVVSETIRDYMRDEVDVVILDYDTPILDAVPKISENNFALVKENKNGGKICGIVTVADISLQFLNVTEPFLLLEQIEINIRQILDGKFLVEEIRDFCRNAGIEKKIDFIDDLNFGNYLRIIENPENWDRLNLSIERSHFIHHMDKVREIRNDVMHFASRRNYP